MKPSKDTKEEKRFLTIRNIVNAVKENHNDMDLGRIIRKMVSDYEEILIKPPLADELTK